jgi:excisionase family DNA binding protein
MSDTDDIKPVYITVKQAAKKLCLGTTKVYEMIAYEGLPVVRFGRAVRINPERLDEWRTKREQAQQSA